MQKQYADSPFGQIHLRMLRSCGEESLPPLVCLHPAPYSGLYFQTVMPLLNNHRRVIALDYPGYGGSADASGANSIADYATAMLAALSDVGVEQPFDILGFHTGCLVAVEMAHAMPSASRRLVLCDIPFFSAEQQAAMRLKMASPRSLTAELTCLDGNWNFDVAGRLEDMSLGRAFELFTEHLRSGENDHLAFAAAFNYDCENRFATLSADVVCLATQSGLHSATLAAAQCIPNSALNEALEIESAVFESGAPTISQYISKALEN